MTILFAGGEMGAYFPAAEDAKERSGLGSSWDSSFSRTGLGTLSTTSYVESATFAATNDIWIHLALADGDGNGSGISYPLTLVAGGSDLFRLSWNSGSGNTITMQYWNGSAWADAASATIAITGGYQHLDIHVVGNSGSGSCEMYASGTLRASATGLNLTSVANITNIRHYGSTLQTIPIVSQCVVATVPTIGMRLFTVPVTGTGATSGWTGTYTNIDETLYQDADFINSNTAAQVSTFSCNAPTLTGYQVLAVAVTARSKRGASGPQNLQLALRSSGTDYFSATKSLGLGYGAYCNVWETDPATSAAWINTAVATLQPGVKSIT